MVEHDEREDLRERSAFLTVVCWVFAVLVVVWSALAWSPMVFAGSASRGELGSWYWAIDLCASLSAQSVIGVAVVFVVVAAMRRLVCAGVLAACLAGLFLLPMSEPRLGGAPDSAESVRVLVYNAHTRSGQLEAKNELLAGSDADVAVVLEVSMPLMRSYIDGEGFRATHMYGRLPKSEWSGGPAILSRIPVEPVGSELDTRLRAVQRDLWDHLYRIEIVHAPVGSFALIQAHARSPRRPTRWKYGMNQLLELADIVGRVEEITQLPVVVVGDFNSPPTSVRARAFADRSGLVRAKPAYRMGGSFPSSVPASLGLAIDGVYASPGVRVKSWKTIGSAGSDHRAVVVDLVLE